MKCALLMAGGKSLRMRKTLGPQHKALVEVAGETLLQRNLAHLAAHGFSDVRIAVSRAERMLKEFVDSLKTTMGSLHQMSLTIVEETQPLGTIGAARLVPYSPILVTNVDNLSSIDLSRMMSHHTNKDADLTIASHLEPFQIPFGELVTDDGSDCISDYREKPVQNIVVSSGTYVLSAIAQAAIPDGQRTDITDLFRALRQQDKRIVAFRHDALWIDVNDRDAVQRANALVLNNANLFASLTIRKPHLPSNPR